ncbi:helix-turn-helix domain-containing protein [Trichococcus shcherbakoviae]|uniref:helix-turn-helix domain-containing protein n=1 Tax=Trichococcus shcherbakoviae TaxID=2094020 RepID=UPI002AA80755|nr:helix-turn-helix transcriptional regulator [Trichococcus shcherbakoviae]
MSFGDLLKKMRKEAKLTQGGLAKKAHISRTYLSDVENNRYNPSVSFIQKITEALYEALGNGDKDVIFNSLMRAVSGMNEVTYGTIDQYALNKFNSILNNNESYEFSDFTKEQIIDDALKQSLKDPLILIFYDKAEVSEVDSLLEDELDKAILRFFNKTDFSDAGFIRFSELELSRFKDRLKPYFDNGIDKNLYDSTINIVDKAINDIKALDK